MTEAKPRLLIVEDDPGLQKQLKWCFDDYELLFAESQAAAIAAVRRFEPPVVLQDLGLPPDPDGASEGIATLRETLRIAPRTKVIVVTGQSDKATAIRSVGLGAYDFYQKPVDAEVLRLLVGRARHLYELEEQNRIASEQRSTNPLAGVIALSEPMVRVCRMIEKVAPTMATTLLLGESGTGKELLARALHDLSPRHDDPFVAINCAAIPENLLESELFGYERGAFTGALKQTPGKLELADRGTLFLDEIGDMPLALQAKLLRFLEERVIERVGGRERIAIDVRVLCATNQDLSMLIERNAFRQDLYYRISEVTVRIPPLRERPGDAAVIAKRALDRYVAQHRSLVRGFAPDALRAIQSYPWPGNVRELENRISAAVIMADGRFVSIDDLGLPRSEKTVDWLNLRVARQRAEREAITQALAIAHGNMSRAAELLGITRPTLYDMLEKHSITVAERSSD